MQRYDHQIVYFQPFQSPFSHLQTFKELATRNAGRVYEEMEFE